MGAGPKCVSILTGMAGTTRKGECHLSPFGRGDGQVSSPSDFDFFEKTKIYNCYIHMLDGMVASFKGLVASKHCVCNAATAMDTFGPNAVEVDMDCSYSSLKVRTATPLAKHVA